MGDAYLVAAGLPGPNADDAVQAFALALEIRDFIRARQTLRGEHSFGSRIGVHPGEVVAGFLGIRKFAYDIRGDTVNTAERLQQCCLEDHVNISATTAALVNEHFHCTYRGEIDAKNKGRLKMYFAEPRLQERVAVEV